jgi:hypothetical protein
LPPNETRDPEKAENERRGNGGPAVLSGRLGRVDHGRDQRRRLVVENDAIDRDRLGDVLHFPLAQVFEREIQLGLHLVEDAPRQADAAGLAQPLQARRHVHPIAEDIVALDDDVADVEAYAVDDPAILGDRRVALGHGRLHLDGEVDGIDDAGEFHQRAVAHQLHGAAAILNLFRLDQVPAQRLEGRKGAGLVLAHQPAIADDVSSKNGG